MAYRESAPEENSDMFEPYNHYWAIHRNVGWGCDNQYDDVMLIQYLINSLKITDRLEPDGLFGNKTYQAIKSFQRWVNREEGNFCIVDGKVNAVAPSVYGVNSTKIYTIYLLSYKFIEKKRIYYADIRIDRELPNALCAMLSAHGE